MLQGRFSPVTRGSLAMTMLAVAAVVSLSRPGNQGEAASEKPAAEFAMKGHETSVDVGQEFFAGTSASIRCAVRAVKSISETVPLPESEVNVQLRAKDGQAFPLAAGKTDAGGNLDATFRVPEVPAGQYTLAVATRSTLGQQKLERTVQVKTGAKILLVTDKPLYQPGQVMHIRALSLRPFDLKPVAGSELTFEVEDSKGNKVYKRTQKTSDFGITSIDFQLADEVNMGDYHIRALVGDHQTDKTVTVKKYVLPKFKSELSVDKRFYMPKEIIHADLQTDYFFGKPVANGKIKVVASTFDIQFREFQTWEGQTDANGHTKFEIKLPDYFVGQPLQKGDALVRLEAKVTDTADHMETISKSYTVSDQPIRVSLIPEGGRLVPGMENRIYAAAIYPDGSPAACEVNLWIGSQAKDEPFATVKTNEAGLAEFKLTPKAEQLRQGPWEQKPLEMLGGQAANAWGPKMLFDVFVQARDGKGSSARAHAEINSDPMGENIILRLDKAIYRAGDTLNMETRSSAGLPTVYYDVVKNGQVLLTKWLDFKDGTGSYKLDLPADLFGTLEVHAYQMLSTGEIIRDSRVIYVQPRDDLKIAIKPDKEVHVPGESGRIHFQVTDAEGKPAAAALGVLIVDEAVYALQEMQPGLEKVYFTLQEELLKPKTEVIFKPRASIDTLVRESEIPADKQQIAQVLLTSVKPKPPSRWQVAPDIERRQKVEEQVQQIGFALYSFAANQNQPVLRYDAAARRWDFDPKLLGTVLKAQYLDAAALKNPLGGLWTLQDLAKLEKDFTPNHLARAVTQARMQQVFWTFINYTNANKGSYFQNGEWSFPETVLTAAARSQRLAGWWLKDAWGKTIKLAKRDRKSEHQTGCTQLDYYDFVSAGPDGEFGTADDVKLPPMNEWQNATFWWSSAARRGQQQGWRRRDLAGRWGGGPRFRGAALGGMGGGMGGMNAPGAAPPMPMAALRMEVMEGVAKNGGAAKPDTGGAAPAPTRIREFFPETMLWQPALITDDQGNAELPVSFADSITTWRLTASASSRSGLLGGVSAPLRVFQDFFVDLDLPVTLTQNDEVAFPVAVYNYLKTPQTVKLDLQRESWFDLTDSAGYTRSLELQPNEVTAVKFRIKARRIGAQPLLVKASGSKMSDAIKRTIEVVPDGSRVEKVVTDRLTGKVMQVIEIPEGAIADASKILVKFYPGVFSQVMEGMEGMLRMPFG
ncbi:MAG TPA: MG2 domain-containing protein [Gemmataceae bacterium]|jgi:hypothetical protein|nr:MG2 domain-containing protein [Gemmataceae bacterium]